MVEVTIEHAWINCPRYVHQMQPIEQSPYIPDATGRFQIALWKRIDLMQDVLTDSDRAEAESLGLITIEDYEARVAAGTLV